MRRTALACLLLAVLAGTAAPASACAGEVCVVLCRAVNTVHELTTGHQVYCRLAEDRAGVTVRLT